MCVFQSSNVSFPIHFRSRFEVHALCPFNLSCCNNVCMLLKRLNQAITLNTGNSLSRCSRHASYWKGIANDRKGGKRKHGSMSSSPNGVTDASFSCGDSGDLWTATSSRQMLFKRSRSKDQQMRLPSINHMFVDVLSSPR
ncbi:hypothetical protein GQ457_09G010720 [Hibiscus cannabinus]